MLMLYSKLENVSVMSLQTGAAVAQVTSPIIDPGTLDIIAYHLSGKGLVAKDTLLLTSDIREVGNMGFIIDSADELVLQNDMIKLAETIKLNFKLIDMEVIDDQKTKLGKIYDFALDPMNFKIHQLYVKRPIMKSFQNSHLIISRTQIIEVNNKHIVVNSASLEEKAQPAAIADSFVNPFRQPNTPSASSIATKK